MSLSDFLTQHVHEKISAFLGAGASVIAPGDILTKIVTGTITGVLIWCITKAIAWSIKKIGSKKCQCDACKE
jgi:hypothetical protein